jgi:hypothetical protein
VPSQASSATPSETIPLEIKSQWNRLSAVAWRASLVGSGNKPESIGDRDRDIRILLIFIAITSAVVICEVVYIGENFCRLRDPRQMVSGNVWHLELPAMRKRQANHILGSA